MTFEDIPQHLRTAAIYAESATARRPVFVPRRLYELVKEYLAWKGSRTRPGQTTSMPVRGVSLGEDVSTPEAVNPGVESTRVDE
jgi:hypothetical protein